MNRWIAIALNVVLFDALWTLALLGAGKQWWWLAPVLIVTSTIVQLRWSPSPARESAVVLAGALVGVGLDWLGSALGAFTFRGTSSAEFLIVFFSLWLNFGTTLRPSLSWMWRRPALAALLGVLGGPLAYWIGSRVGAIAFGEPASKSLGWVAVQYGTLLPVWMYAASKVVIGPDGTGRLLTAPATTQPGGRPA